MATFEKLLRIDVMIASCSSRLGLATDQSVDGGEAILGIIHSLERNYRSNAPVFKITPIVIFQQFQFKRSPSLALRWHDTALNNEQVFPFVPACVSFASQSFLSLSNNARYRRFHSVALALRSTGW